MSLTQTNSTQDIQCARNVMGCPAGYSLQTSADQLTTMCLSFTQYTDVPIWSYADSQQYCALKSSGHVVAPKTDAHLEIVTSFMQTQKDDDLLRLPASPYFHTSGTQNAHADEVYAGWSWYDGDPIDVTNDATFAITTAPDGSTDDGDEDCLYLSAATSAGGNISFTLTDFRCDNTAVIVCEQTALTLNTVNVLSSYMPWLSETYRCVNPAFEQFTYIDGSSETCLLIPDRPRASSLDEAAEACAESSARVVAPKYVDGESLTVEQFKQRNDDLAAWIDGKLSVKNSKYWIDMQQPDGYLYDGDENWKIRAWETDDYVYLPNALTNRTNGIWRSTDPETNYLGQDFIHAISGNESSWSDVSSPDNGLDVLCESPLVVLSTTIVDQNDHLCANGTTWDDSADQCVIDCGDQRRRMSDASLDPNFHHSGRALSSVDDCDAVVDSHCATPSASDSETGEAGSSGDPHLYFAHGGTADFRGRNGTSYALLSAPGVQFAGRIEDADFLLPRPQLVHGSFFVAVSWTLRDASGRLYGVRVSHDQPNLQIVDPRTGDVIDDRASVRRQWSGDGVRVFQHGRTTCVRANGWESNATRQPIYNPVEARSKVRYDLALRPLDGATGLEALHGRASASCFPHGLLGQSFDDDDLAVDGRTDDYAVVDHQRPVITTRAQAEGAIEGDARDYALSSALSTHFRFSRFDAARSARCAPRNVSVLTGTKRPLAPLASPRHAQAGSTQASA